MVVHCGRVVDVVGRVVNVVGREADVVYIVVEVVGQCCGVGLNMEDCAGFSGHHGGPTNKCFVCLCVVHKYWYSSSPVGKSLTPEKLANSSKSTQLGKSLTPGKLVKTKDPTDKFDKSSKSKQVIVEGAKTEKTTGGVPNPMQKKKHDHVKPSHTALGQGLKSVLINQPDAHVFERPTGFCAKAIPSNRSTTFETLGREVSHFTGSFEYC